MEPSHVSFRGPGPFHLFVAQSATARDEGTSVTVTLYATLDGRGGDLEAVSFQIAPGPARQLSLQLMAAVEQIEQKGGDT